jgi:aspartyl-tRNA(Asn)/glutamyl-tRNA(Gln) amidotransferase subunit A
MQLYQRTARLLLEELDKKTISSSQLTEEVLNRIASVDKKIGAYVHVNEKGAADRAGKIDENPSGKLKGIPIAIKDNICVKDELTRCSSKILEGFRPPYNATVIDKLLAEGAVLLGKTNMDEFAFGSSTESSAYKVTRNPWDTDRIPGGSSGGPCAAVAADEAIMALGSDTGGSIRQPASLCGVVGMKPTYGRVSRYGLIAFASSLDQIGPITKDVYDCALLLSVIAGYDPMDSTCCDIPVPDYTRSLKKDIKGLKIGIPKEYFIKGIDPEVESSLKQSIEVYKKLGAVCESTSLPHTEYAVSTYYIVAPSEASSNLARFDGVQYGHRSKGGEDLIDTYKKTREEGFGPEAKRRIILGTYALSSGYYQAYYLRALKVRTLIKQDFERCFEKFDCILTPTSPTPAFKIKERVDDPLAMYLSDIFTISANLAGLPAISIPCGFTKDELPIGMQLIGKPFDEETVLRTAYGFEQATQWHKRKPRL